MMLNVGAIIKHTLCMVPGLVLAHWGPSAGIFLPHPNPPQYNKKQIGGSLELLGTLSNLLVCLCLALTLHGALIHIKRVTEFSNT